MSSPVLLFILPGECPRPLPSNELNFTIAKSTKIPVSIHSAVNITSPLTGFSSFSSQLQITFAINVCALQTLCNSVSFHCVYHFSLFAIDNVCARNCVRVRFIDLRTKWIWHEIHIHSINSFGCHRPLHGISTQTTKQNQQK